MSATFRAFRKFNDPALSHLTGLRKRLDRRALPYLVPPRARTALVDKLVTELAERGALPTQAELDQLTRSGDAS